MEFIFPTTVFKSTPPLFNVWVELGTESPKVSDLNPDGCEIWKGL